VDVLPDKSNGKPG